LTNVNEEKYFTPGSQKCAALSSVNDITVLQACVMCVHTHSGRVA